MGIDPYMVLNFLFLLNVGLRLRFPTSFTLERVTQLKN